MPLHPAPTISNHLCIVTQKISHSATSHISSVVYAVVNGTAMSTQAVAEAVQSAWNDNWPTEMDTNSTSQRPEVVEGDGTNVPSVAVATGAAAAGAVARACPPPQVCMLVKKLTPLGGKKNRGRMYIPYNLSQAGVDEAGLITGSAVPDNQVVADNFLGDLVAASLPMVIANKVLALDVITGKPYVTEINAGPEVTSVIVEDHVATQRRRLVRS